LGKHIAKKLSVQTFGDLLPEIHGVSIQEMGVNEL